MKFRSLTSNFISFAGLLIFAVCLVLVAFVLVADWIGFEFNPYIGVVAFLILPAVATFGIILIPVGKAWERKRAAARGGSSGLIKVEIDLDKASTRRRILMLTVTAAVVLSFMAATAYESLVFMDTTTFCGEVCHSVMMPELTSYRRSPHARVRCVDCHIGEGADWFVRSKLSGTRQVFAVMLETYERPIPTPVENLRPARETCEHCHWPEKFHGSKLVVNTHYTPDEANSPLKNVLLMKTGGGLPGGEAEGIHWHTSFNHKVEYVALDHQRDTIPYVRLVHQDGTEVEYVADDSKHSIEELRAMPRRTMDCMDCHNRPSHIFEVPEVAVDQSITSGEIAADLPFVKRESVRLLTEPYPTREDAEAKIKAGLRDFYTQNYPDLASAKSPEIDRAAATVADIYLRNIFPSMKITWGTYRTQIGHTYANGCFRCHDDSHSAEDGRTISQDCGTCHEVLAMEEENPAPTIENLPKR